MRLVFAFAIDVDGRVPYKTRLNNPARPGREQRYLRLSVIRGARPLFFSSKDAMSYQVIARKWRPQSFEQLVGQSHISTTLLNSLRNDRLPHALLFTGPRGTGKTSSARILAKSLRCPNAVDLVPCHTCQSCTDIAQGRSIDVLEIDGASNNGVDAIRDLREGVSFMPSTGFYKVYIIDEVHMLSGSAFNALLKTLEEPPAHVIFIMATTEAHKIPQTILSRCQRFDFRSISTRQIADHLKKICQADGIQADDESLWMIARQGQGSMRDSQSLLDQVIAFSQGHLDRASVISILGLTDRAMLLDILSTLVYRDEGKMLTHLERISASGVEPTLFCQELLESIRNALLIKLSIDENHPLIELPDSEVRFFKDITKAVAEEDLHLLFDMTLKGASDLKHSLDPRLVLEVVLLRMVKAPKMFDLKKMFQSGNLTLTSAASANPTSMAAAVVNVKQTVKPPPSSSNASLGLNPSEKWFQFVQKLKQLDAILSAKVENVLFISESNKTIRLSIPESLSFLESQLSDPETKQKLNGLIESHYGVGYRVVFDEAAEGVGQSAQSVSVAKAKVKEDEIRQKVAEHPMVKSATEALKGGIKSVRPIK